MKDRYEWENNRNRDLEKKSYRLLLLSTGLIPLIKYLDINYQEVIIGMTVITVFFFFLVIKLTKFKHPLDPDDYFNKDGCIDDKMIKKDMNLKLEKIIESRVRAYLDCSHHNKKVASTKIKYMQWISLNIVFQIGMIFVLSMISIFQNIHFHL